ncbi:MAG TPA: chemotaxis protein CheB [Polyangiaceae bacterium]
MSTKRTATASAKTKKKAVPVAAKSPHPAPDGIAFVEPGHAYDVLVLVASAGGQAALLAVLRQLPPDFGVPIVLMQHLPPESTAVDQYVNRVPFAVQWADAHSKIEPQKILFCPPRSFVELLPDGSLQLSPSQSSLDKPMDRLLRSAARSFADRAIAVVLTGMGDDAAAGALELYRAGGRVLVQSEASAEHPDMPRALIKAGAADLVVPLSALGQVIGEVVAGTPRARAPSELESIARVFGDHGEVAKRAREVDWSQTLLGPVLSWPTNLKVMTRVAIESTGPMCISWGPELVQIYNDKFVQFLGETSHPLVLGGRARENWPDVWRIVGPMLERVTTGSEATGVANAPFYLSRGGVVEEVFVTLDCAPIRDPESGAIVGVYQTATDTTAIVVAERRMRLLRNLASRITGAPTPREACERAAAAFAEEAADLPFALIYQIDATRRQATLAGAAGLSPGTPGAPRSVNLGGADGAETWPLRRALTGAVLLEDLANRLPALEAVEALPSGTLPPRSAMLLPLAPSGDKAATAVLIAGLSPHRPLDGDYRSFLELVAQQISAGKNEARARQIERERLDQLAELDHAKTEFFANVSHEFRTPLTLLLAPLEELRQRRDELPPQLASEIDVAARNSRRLLRLVNDLLDFSSVETRRQRPPLELTNLGELTHDVASAFRNAVERAGLSFDVEIEPMALVPVNRDMWEKVVANLLSNALKFTFDGGIGVSLKALPMHAELAVSDTGIGIPAQELPNIFKRFHRVRGAKARTVEGSGMGLAIVHDLVARMGGQLVVRSVEGRGTTFTIWMPFKKPRHALDTSEARSVSASGQRLASDLASEAAAWNDAEEPGPRVGAQIELSCSGLEAREGRGGRR